MVVAQAPSIDSLNSEQAEQMEEMEWKVLKYDLKESENMPFVSVNDENDQETGNQKVGVQAENGFWTDSDDFSDLLRSMIVVISSW